MRDPYAVLGVGRDAGDDDIKAAWQVRVTAAMQAVDLGRAKEVDAAYEVLRDRHRRAVYDRTGVVPERPRLAPEDRLAANETGFRAWTPADRPAPQRQVRHPMDLPPSASDGRRLPRRPVNRPLVTLVAIVLLTVAGIPAFEFGGSQGSRLAGAGSSANDKVHVAPLFASSGVDIPDLHLVDGSHRLLSRVAAPAGSGGYTVMSKGLWDPCQPIRYVVNGTPPFGRGDQLLKSAIKEVSRDSGLKLVDDGATAEAPSAGRYAYQPSVYGDRWAPVLIAWTDSSVIGRLGGDVDGLGGGMTVTLRGHPQVVSGIVYLDAPQLARTMGTGRPGAAEVRTVMLHELGHLLGLGHVADPASVMSPSTRPGGQRLTAGDLRGLAYAGSGPCLPFAAGG